ncbi:MAG TPA: pyruvate kinase [Deltaproteobacteria bacterium]|nr:pyruvate kinase [Deltaproteobacteria bacterium]
MYADRPDLDTRTKIVATLGPASWEEPVLTRLLEAGVDVCRINCSHADHESIRRQVARVRRVAMRLHKPTAILLDLQGPKVRTGAIPEPLELSPGDILTVVMDEDLIGRQLRIGTTYPQMASDVSTGDPVLFADGALAGCVVAIRGGAPAEVDIRIDQGGALGSHKGINLPTVDLSIPCLTEKDLADLAVGVEVGIDYVALSFVQRAADVVALRGRLTAHSQPDIPIIAKIEKPCAVERIDEILEVADGVMVARGDLGVEVSIEKVPVYQKRILAAASRAGKLAITATQMLDSMERNPRPTRAETTDVANAILDGTDAVMLSGETSIGRYPVEAVQMMDKISREVEGSRFFRSLDEPDLPTLGGSAGLVVRSACYAAAERARPLVVFSWRGITARQVSKTRPLGPLYALTDNPRTADRLSLAWGVIPIVVPRVDTTDELLRVAEAALLQSGRIRLGEEIVVLVGPSPSRETANLMKIHQLGEGPHGR